VGEPVPARSVLEVHLLEESGAADGDGPVQAGPELVVARPLDLVVFGRLGVRRGVEALREPECTGAGQRPFAGVAAADIEVLVPSHVDRERALRFQAAPGTVVTQHGLYQLRPGTQRYL
jgi:hypothetical protein